MAFNASYAFMVERTVVLQHPKGKYLRINPNNHAKLDENGGTGKWAQWKILFDGTKDGQTVVRLQHSVTNKCLRIMNGNMDSNGGLGKYTRFKLHKTGGNKAKLESVEHPGKYPAVQPKGPTIGGGGKWTEFTFYRQAGGHGVIGGGGYGHHKHKQCKITIKSHHGRFVCAEDNHSMIANREKAAIWEIFISLPKGHGQVALKTYHGKFVCAQDDGTIAGNRDKLGPWEQFHVEKNGNKWAFKSCHGKYLSAQSDHTLQWNRDKLGPWEGFEVNVV